MKEEATNQRPEWMQKTLNLTGALSALAFLVGIVGYFIFYGLKAI